MTESLEFPPVERTENSVADFVRFATGDRRNASRREVISTLAITGPDEITGRVYALQEADGVLTLALLEEMRDSLSGPEFDLEYMEGAGNA